LHFNLVPRRVACIGVTGCPGGGLSRACGKPSRGYAQVGRGDPRIPHALDIRLYLVRGCITVRQIRSVRTGGRTADNRPPCCIPGSLGNEIIGIKRHGHPNESEQNTKQGGRSDCHFDKRCAILGKDYPFTPRRVSLRQGRLRKVTATRNILPFEHSFTLRSRPCGPSL